MMKPLVHIVDLIHLAKDSKVVFEGHISIDSIISITNHNKIVFLNADEEVVKRAYFDRQDKEDMYKLIKTLPDSKEIIDKIYNMTILGNNEHLAMARDRGIKVISRDINSIIPEMISSIEDHFHLNL